MIVTASAAERQAKEYQTCRVRHVVERVLTSLGLVAGIGHIRAEDVEARRDEGVDLLGEQLVTGQLLRDKPIIRLVGVEAGDDIVSIAPSVRTRLVELEA